MDQKRVVIAMSGGVDSAAAALLLQQAGYAVSGVTLRLHGTARRPEPASAAEDIRMAKEVAAALGIPHRVLDLSELFEREVVDKFVAEYAAGRTPNPCIDCNRTIKFGALMDWALAEGADYMATGHYARVGQDPASGRWQLLRGTDRHKDQSYVLYQLSQDQLAHLLLPLGALDKPAVRAVAAERGLVNAGKSESQDICFIPDGDYVAFLRSYGGLCPQPGDFVDCQGRVLGRHRGQECYTIGQRKGLGVSADAPLYVVRKDPAAGQVVLGEAPALLSDRLLADGVNWVSWARPEGPRAVGVKTRYSQKEAAAVIEPLSDGRVLVRFDQPQRAITPGQAVVFYDGDAVVGGGTICQTEDEKKTLQ